MRKFASTAFGIDARLTQKSASIQQNASKENELTQSASIARRIGAQRFVFLGAKRFSAIGANRCAVQKIWEKLTMKMMPEIQAYKGQIYERVGVEPYMNRKGWWVDLILWRSCCVDCGEVFVCKQSIRVKKFSPTRRCEVHRRKA